MNEHDQAHRNAYPMMGSPGALDGGYSQQFHRATDPSPGIIQQPSMARTYADGTPMGQVYTNPWSVSNEDFAANVAKKWGMSLQADIVVYLAELKRTFSSTVTHAVMLARHCDSFQEWKDAVAWLERNPEEYDLQRYAQIKRLVNAIKLAGITLAPLVSVSRSVAHYQVIPNHAAVFRTIMYLYGIEPDVMSASLPMLSLHIEVQQHSPGKVEIILTDLNPSETTMQSFRKLYEYSLRQPSFVK